MIVEETLTKLRAMKFYGMADAFEQQCAQPETASLDVMDESGADAMETVEDLPLLVARDADEPDVGVRHEVLRGGDAELEALGHALAGERMLSHQRGTGRQRTLVGLARPDGSPRGGMCAALRAAPASVWSVGSTSSSRSADWNTSTRASPNWPRWARPWSAAERGASGGTRLRRQRRGSGRRRREPRARGRGPPEQWAGCWRRPLATRTSQDRQRSSWGAVAH